MPNTQELWSAAIDRLVDVYRGPVPVGDCISAAFKLDPTTAFRVYVEYGQEWMEIRFADSSIAVIGLSEG